MFIEKSHTEVVTVDEEIKVVGLSLQKSGLPVAFDSLGKLWGIYGEKYRGRVANAVVPGVEYAICVNTALDYITGCAVTETDDLRDGWLSYIIPKGRYIKDTFNAETFEQLTTETMQQRDVKAWVEKNHVRISGEFSVEVYPSETLREGSFEMYTLTPVKE